VERRDDEGEPIDVDLDYQRDGTTRHGIDRLSVDDLPDGRTGVVEEHRRVLELDEDLAARRRPLEPAEHAGPELDDLLELRLSDRHLDRKRLPDADVGLDALRLHEADLGLPVLDVRDDLKRLPQLGERLSRTWLERPHPRARAVESEPRRASRVPELARSGVPRARAGNRVDL
jgi:hypothetical protein